MIRFVVKVTEQEEGNDHYDPNLSNNGGGYHQPRIEVTTISGMKIVVDDASCGDFGARVWITLSFQGSVLAECKFDPMEGDYYSSFIRQEPLHDAAFVVVSALGYGGCFVFEDEVAALLGDGEW